jgi:hypothetical protein
MVRNPLTPFTEPAYLRFVELANRGLLHYYDWGRFYQFVIVCHRYQLKRTGGDLEELFRDSRFSELMIREMVMAYDHCRGILRVRGPTKRR